MKPLVWLHELRISDGSSRWRVMYWLDPDAVVIVDVFAKKTITTPRQVIENCIRRLRRYDDASRET